jgi:hypothetical protein
MSDEFDLDTHCVVCREPRGSHPTESNNPRPLFDEGRACRDCDSYIVAARVQTMMLNMEQREQALETIHNFLSLTAGMKEAKRIADEMMQTEMTRLEAEETARNEDHGVLLDDGEEEDDDDDTEEDWS